MASEISNFLVETSEFYHSSSWSTRSEIIKDTRTKLIEWKCHRIDLASYINAPSYENGETELMNTFRWNTNNLSMMCEWFLLLVEFGGNPLQNNKDGLDAYDIGFQRFKEEGLDDEFPAFVKEVEEILKKNKGM